MKKSEEDLAQKLGTNFKDRGNLHTALIHRSFLNENSKEKNSNERLEFLGDAILEFITSAALYKMLPNLTEGELTAIRSRLVNTESLAQEARKLSLGEYLYMSRGEEKSGGRNNTTLLANTFEAVIGAIFIDQGISACQNLIEKLILSKVHDARKHLKDSKSLLQELIQAKGQRAPVYKVTKEVGPDHARIFTVGVFIEGEQLASGVGKNKQEAEQEAAKEALGKL